MSYQTVFQRYEIKYLLTQKQKSDLLKIMEPHMAIDAYGRTTIRNLYFDTYDYRLIRHSIEKPTYKEKLRIRSYQRATEDSPVFVELKKKYKHVVYKRRIALPEVDAMSWLCDGFFNQSESQIAAEINYFLDYYKTLHPTVFLSYEREAYYDKGSSDFRVTFDEAILCRETDLSLRSEIGGTPILDNNLVLMEIKFLIRFLKFFQ